MCELSYSFYLIERFSLILVDICIYIYVVGMVIGYFGRPNDDDDIGGGGGFILWSIYLFVLCIFSYMTFFSFSPWLYISTKEKKLHINRNNNSLLN